MAKWYCVTNFHTIIPKMPGCYAIYKYNVETHTKKLLYIGTAQNLKIRLNRGKHEVLRVLNALLDLPEMPYIKCRNIDKDRFLLEKKLIERLKPKVN